LAFFQAKFKGMSDTLNDESDRRNPSGSGTSSSVTQNLGKQDCQKQANPEENLSLSLPQDEVPSQAKRSPFGELSPTTGAFTMRQQNVQKLLLQFAKTFIAVMESTVWAKSDWDEDEDGDDEADEYCDNFGCLDNAATNLGIRMNSIGIEIGGTRSGDSIGSTGLQPISDEEFPYEKYFAIDQKDKFRSVFTSVACELFTSYEYQLIMLVREKRKIAEIAEDIAHRILDDFKESTRGTNPEYIKPEITPQFLIEKALHHSEPEGIIYNSEWSAVEILENPGIIVRKGDQQSGHDFYQSDWQKNFIGVKKLIGYKYGFRLHFDFETEQDILKNFEKVHISSVSPLYLSYEYCLDPSLLQSCKDQLARELLEEEQSADAQMKSNNANLLTNTITDSTDHIKNSFAALHEEKNLKDRARLFQSKLQIQRLEEEKNSDEVMKQIINLSQRFETLHTKLAKLEQKGVINSGNMEELNRAKAGLLRSNYHVRFEVRDPGGIESHHNQQQQQDTVESKSK
jgi:hypothetical protein